MIIPKNRPKNHIRSDEEIAKEVGNPHYPELSENTLRTRRNLLFACFVSMFVAYGKIDPANSSWLGIKFQGISHNFVENVFIGIIFYLLIHFGAQILLWYMKTKINSTGHGKAVIPTTGQEVSTEEYQPANVVDFLFGKKTELDKMIKKMHSWIEQDKVAGEHLVRLDREMNAILNLSNTINLLMRRYEKCWHRYQLHQLAYYTVIEFGLPIIFAIFSIIVLVSDCARS